MLEKALTGTKKYYGWMAALLAVISVGFACYLWQFQFGLGITGMSRDVSWGFYIAQFTFLVGVAASAVMVVLPYYLHNYKAFGRITILGEFLAVASVTMCILFIFVDLGQPFEALIDSVGRDGKLTFFGRFALRQFLIAKLCNRLRIIEALKRFPEITRQKIDRPVFITGWYRCGTTYLHNLLATHPELRAPLYWELMHPCPAVDPRKVNSQKLIHKTNLANRIHRYLAPGFNAAHAMPAEKPEECLHLFENAAMGTTAFFITEAKSIAWWLLDQDVGPGYHFYKDQLKLLNWLRPGRRWVLKWPFHLWHLDSLIEAFPDATIIHLHRDPREALPSVCSLAALARSSFCESIDNEELGQFWLDYCEAGLQRGLTAREKADENQVIDIRYPDLMANPLAVINRVINIIDLNPSEAWRNSLQSKFEITQKKKPDRHHYAPAQFGLDPNKIQERFSKYIEDYDLSA